MPVYQARSQDLNQGDIFADVRILIPIADQAPRRLSQSVIVVSHDCDCDKATGNADGTDPTLAVVTVAPVWPLGYFSDEGLQGHVRAGRVVRYWYLPEENGNQEQAADLALMQPVPVAVLSGHTRLASLSDEYRGRMHVHLQALLTRPGLPPPEIGGGE